MNAARYDRMYRWQLGIPEHHPRSAKQLHNRYSYLQKTTPAKATLGSQNVAEELATVIITPTSSIEMLGSLFAVNRSPTVNEAVAPAVVSALVSSDTATSVSDTATSAKKRKYDKMSVEAATAFTKLYQEHRGKNWTFEAFQTLWNADKYGAMDRERWRTRNQTEARREAGKEKRKKLKSTL
jgi:hypothetical protein